MLFNVFLKENLQQTPGINLLISGNSWSDCVQYCETLGENIVSINSSLEQLIINDNVLNSQYYVMMIDVITNTRTTYIIFDTLDNVLTWINLQSEKTLQSIQKQNRQFISI